MSEYLLFDEIINEIKVRTDADPVGILEEYISPLVKVCNEINQWLGENPDFDLHYQPPWYEKFLVELVRFDTDFSGEWQKQREEIEVNDGKNSQTNGL